MSYKICISIHCNLNFVLNFCFRIIEYNGCERLCRDIQIQIATRNSKPKLSTEYSQISANIRIKLLQFKSELDQLNQKLKQSSQKREKV